MQMVQFECHRHWKPSVSSTFGVGWIPFSHYWPSGVIRIGLPIWRWKSWKSSGTKWAQWAANGPVWMPQALKPLWLIQFRSWMNPLFPLLAFWGNKKWPPIMTEKKLKIFWNKMGSMGCKWSRLNAPSSQIPLPHPFLEFWAPMAERPDVVLVRFKRRFAPPLPVRSFRHNYGSLVVNLTTFHLWG